MRAFFARMNAGAYNGKRNCRITKEFDCTKGKSEGDRGEKKVKCVCLSPEGCTKQDNEVFLKKSDKITFSKINFLPFKPKGNTRFLKNYGIAVFFFLSFIILNLKNFFLSLS